MRNRNAKALNGNAKRCFKLMIVDDSNLMRRRIERSQQFEGLQLVGTAGNGLDALELFKRTDPDVVTMDITMPRMNGIECIGRSEEHTSELQSQSNLVCRLLLEKKNRARRSQEHHCLF